MRDLKVVVSSQDRSLIDPQNLRPAQVWGASFFLLGGISGVVPRREVSLLWAPRCEGQRKLPKTSLPLVGELFVA